MHAKDQIQSQGRSLIQFGVVLLLLGLPAVLVLLGRIPGTADMIDHGDVCINGAMLVFLGLIWSRLHLRRGWYVILFRLTFFATLTKWLGLLLLLAWLARDDAQGVANSTFESLRLDDPLIGLCWSFLAFILVIACVLAVHLSIRYWLERAGGLGERRPPSP